MGSLGEDPNEILVSGWAKGGVGGNVQDDADVLNNVQLEFGKQAF